MNEVIAATGLTIEVSIGGRIVSVVRDLTFALREGEILGIVGESGSGKSMTARALMRLLPANARARGEVLVNGRDVLELDAAGLRELRRNELAMVFQDPRSHIDPLYRAGDHMTEALRIHLGMDRRSARARCLELLESVGITDSERVFAAYPFELSGGMLQRVMIATALAVDPMIVIADEPTTALDVTIQAEIMALIIDLRRRRNLSVVFITHDLDLAATVCDRILVMYAGQAMEVHQASTVFADPLHPYTAALHGARAAIERRSERMNAIPGAPPNPLERPSGCPFHPRCRFAEPACCEIVPTLMPFGEDSAACLRTDELRAILRSGRSE
jgi:oligopeptide/dipeptide ABC transporter ATP-binding protein